MKYIISFVCLCLTGCFNSAPKPNPQIKDTILCDHTCNEIILEDEKTDMPEENDIFAGNYETHEVVAKIFFCFDSVKLSDRDKVTLQPVAEQLKRESEKSVYIFGYTDWYGKDVYNDSLSERRAQVIADYLQTLGVSKDKIYTIALGSRFATPNLSKPDGLKDRRCDLVIR